MAGKRRAVPACTPVSPHTICKLYRCSAAPCATTPPVVAGRLPSTSEVGSGASVRELRQKLLDAARRRDIDVVIVWRLDRWGRSMADLVTTLQELRDLDVGFVSLTEALDLTTPSGRAMAACLRSLGSDSV